MFAFSAPGESPPPQQRNTRRTVSDTRRSSQTISEMYRMKRREGSDGQHPSVSVTRTPFATEHTFTVS